MLKDKYSLLLEKVRGDPEFISFVNQKHFGALCPLDESDYIDEYKKYLKNHFYQMFAKDEHRSDKELAEEIRKTEYQYQTINDTDKNASKLIWVLCGRHGLEVEYMLADILNDIALVLEKRTGLFLDADIPL